MKNPSVRLVGVVLIVAVAAGIAAPRVWRWWTAPPAGYCPFCLRHEHKDSVVKFRASGNKSFVFAIRDGISCDPEAAYRHPVFG